MRLGVGASDDAAGWRLRLQLLQRQLELLDSPLDLLRRAAELRPPQPGNLHLQLLDLQRLGKQSRLGGRQLLVARASRSAACVAMIPCSVATSRGRLARSNRMHGS